MGYLDDIKTAEKNMRKTFGKIQYEDLSDYEKNLYQSVLTDMHGKEPYAYEAEIKAEMVENERKRHDAWNYFLGMTGKGDKEVTRLYNEYQNAKQEQERISDLIKAKNVLVDASEKEIKKLTPIEEAAKKAYDKKVSEIERKYNDAVASAMEKFADKVAKPEKDLQKKYPEMTKIAEELEPLDSNIQLADKTLEAALAEQKKYAEDSKEYNDAEEIIDHLLEQKAQLRKQATPLRNRYNELKAKIAGNNQKLAEKNHDADEKLKKLADDREKALAKALSKYQPKKDALDAAKNENDKHVNERYKLVDEAYAAEHKGNLAKDACIHHADSILLDEYNALLDKKNAFDKYMKIDSAIKNHDGEINKGMYARELGNLTKAYMIYHNKYTKTQRFFRWWPFAKAHKDYNAFSRLRNTFMRATGAKKDEINDYLDNNRMTGDLKANMQGSEIHRENLEIWVHKDYTRIEGVKTEAYAQRMTDLANNALFTGIAGFGENLVKIDEGLKMLNALGDELRRNPDSEALNSAINAVKSGCKKYGLVGAYSSDIYARIENALLPETERKEIPVNFKSEDEHTRYNRCKAIVNEAAENEVNMVLLHDMGNYVPVMNKAPEVVDLAVEKAKADALLKAQEEKAKADALENAKREQRNKERQQMRNLERLAEGNQDVRKQVEIKEDEPKDDLDKMIENLQNRMKNEKENGAPEEKEINLEDNELKFQ